MIEQPAKKKERDEYDAQYDFTQSLEEAYRAIKERVAAGGEPWNPERA